MKMKFNWFVFVAWLLVFLVSFLAAYGLNGFLAGSAWNLLWCVPALVTIAVSRAIKEDGDKENFHQADLDRELLAHDIRLDTLEVRANDLEETCENLIQYCDKLDHRLTETIERLNS